MVLRVRVAVNAHFFHHPGTGHGQYLLNLLRALSRVAPEIEALPMCDGVPPRPTGGWPAGQPPHQTRAGGRWPRDLRKVWWEQVTWPRLAARAAAGVCHVPYFAPPLVHAGNVPVVATIHDLIPLIIPEYVTNPLVRLYNALVSAGARRADVVLVDSQASRRDVLRLLRLPPERVQVVYLAPDEAVCAAVPPAQVAAVRTKYGLHDPFILYLGGLDKRKNVPALLAAMAALPRRAQAQLAISGALGRPNRRLFPDLPKLAAQLGIADRVRFLGFAPDEDKPALYRAATCFAYPAVYEGFGLDPLEAMACGTPVVCSDRSSLPEVTGEAALLVDPQDTVAFAAALARVLADGALRADLAGRGRAQAAKFTWDATARQTAAAYQAALEMQASTGRSKAA